MSDMSRNQNTKTFFFGGGGGKRLNVHPYLIIAHQHTNANIHNMRIIMVTCKKQYSVFTNQI